VPSDHVSSDFGNHSYHHVVRVQILNFEKGSINDAQALHPKHSIKYDKFKKLLNNNYFITTVPKTGVYYCVWVILISSHWGSAAVLVGCNCGMTRKTFVVFVAFKRESFAAWKRYRKQSSSNFAKCICPFN
jgi:hypothetical protein